MEKDKLTKEEIEAAKENGFILTGKTGTGKTTLLNALFGKVVGLSQRSSKSVTQISKVYYYKLENGKCISLIDTPGIDDADKTHNEKIDNIHLKGITDTIAEEKIHIKGILFLVNFQIERFDATEQDALLNYNKLFPLKNFWKNLVIIYTHYYGEEDGESKESIREIKNKTNSEIFSKLMEKVKDVSNVVEYKDLKIKYFNAHSEPKSETQKKNNIKYRDELEILFDELSKNGPLFSQIEYKHIENYKLKENGKEYNAEVEIIGYFDFNHIPIKESINVIKKVEIVPKVYYPPTTCETYVTRANISSNGSLYYQTEKGNSSNSHYLRRTIGTIGGAASALGAAGAGAAIAAGGVGALLTAPVSVPIVVVGGAVALLGAGIGNFFSSLF